ncbi:hypothetical protein TAMA11512_02130 [Selenomonas sp. TAMA-11512]|uniref:hypothetical protein n=1 Tax=Selenomonas sp. TAMA-11512 TaxID=3095337 RepID=UPI003093ABAE|nr:hypothetical protein TAMA11512_02130 [Selenomonas sp. TAMA-11512]
MFIEDAGRMQPPAHTKEKAGANTNTKEHSKASAVKADANGDTFDALFENFRKEQEAFDSLLNEVDMARYKLALADHFWSGKNNAMKHLESCMRRMQKRQAQERLTTLLLHWSHLHMLR